MAEDIEEAKNKLIAELSKKAKYPWDKCVADRIKDGYSKESAEKICGAIRAGTVNKKEEEMVEEPKEEVPKEEPKEEVKEEPETTTPEEKPEEVEENFKEEIAEIKKQLEEIKSRLPEVKEDDDKEEETETTGIKEHLKNLEKKFNDFISKAEYKSVQENMKEKLATETKEKSIGPIDLIR